MFFSLTFVINHERVGIDPFHNKRRRRILHKTPIRRGQQGRTLRRKDRKELNKGGRRFPFSEGRNISKPFPRQVPGEVPQKRCIMPSITPLPGRKSVKIIGADPKNTLQIVATHCFNFLRRNQPQPSHSKLSDRLYNPTYLDGRTEVKYD